jgi:hypothetical protein
VRIRHDAIEPIKAVYTPMQAQMFKLWRTFKDSELEVIIDFLVRSTALAVSCAETLRQNRPGSSKSQRHMIQKPPLTSPAHRVKPTKQK